MKRKPDFNQFLKVLERKATDRPTLFELFLNGPLYERLAGRPDPRMRNSPEELLFLADAFAAAGYDYATVYGSDMTFGVSEKEAKATLSLNDSEGMTSRRDFDEYPWPDPESLDYSKLERVAPGLPEGLKLVVMGPGGVLENVTSLVGYDNLCFMLYDDPDLLQDIFDAVGQRLLRYYELSLRYETVGAIISNDDWGFNTQTFLSTEHMRKYVYPWHKKIVDACHRAGRPVILHSCGNFHIAMEDVIETLRYDAKHSYEDTILPVEEAYERWGRRIAILGGIDVDFIIRSIPEDIRRRCLAMLDRTRERGGYALGTGNSVPEYIPQDHYFAMIDTICGAC